MSGEGKVIISCTTTCQRLPMLLYTLTSLQQQTRQPDRIVVNISKEPFLSDTGIESIPAWLEKEAVEINWVPNTGPYRKLLPLLNQCSVNDKVITVDDDVLYHPEWLAMLIQMDMDHPEHLVCTRARKMKRGHFGWKRYSHWRVLKSRSQGMDIMPTGSGGILYKKSLLDMDFINDPKAQELAPTTDDLWFRMAGIRLGTPVLVDPDAGRKNIFLKHDLGLEAINKKSKKHKLSRLLKAAKPAYNDINWKKICYYSDNLSD
jgi:hypothetical protein